MAASEEKTPGSEPGWFEDPEEIAAERLWDGAKWTNEVRGDAPAKPSIEAEPNGDDSSLNLTPATKEKGGAIRKSVRKRPVLWVAATGLIALIGGVAIGGSDTTELDQRDQEISTLKAELAVAEATADEAAIKQADLAIRERKLDKREAKITATEAIQERNTIPDGIWKVGTDFDVGTYRAEGGSGCYWALLNSADTSDIVNNGGFSANQTLTIDSAWFETQDCGEWRKIG